MPTVKNVHHPKIENKEKNTEKILEKYLDSRERKLNEEKIKIKR